MVELRARVVVHRITFFQQAAFDRFATRTSQADIRIETTTLVTPQRHPIRRSNDDQKTFARFGEQSPSTAYLRHGGRLFGLADRVLARCESPDRAEKLRKEIDRRNLVVHNEFDLGRKPKFEELLDLQVFDEMKLKARTREK